MFGLWLATSIRVIITKVNFVCAKMSTHPLYMSMWLKSVHSTLICRQIFFIHVCSKEVVNVIACCGGLFTGPWPKLHKQLTVLILPHKIARQPGMEQREPHCSNQTDILRKSNITRSRSDTKCTRVYRLDSFPGPLLPNGIYRHTNSTPSAIYVGTHWRIDASIKYATRLFVSKPSRVHPFWVVPSLSSQTISHLPEKWERV